MNCGEVAVLDSILVASAHDEHALSLMSKALREWEPALELFVALDNSMIFEPDGTLYAVCLSGSSLTFRHHRRQAEVGDGLVVPQGVTIDADPGIDLVCVRHEGTPPFHFRERFIQGVGFEHVKRTDRQTQGWVALEPATDLRHRLPLTGLGPGGSTVRCEASAESVQLIVISRGDGLLQVDSGQPLVEPRDAPVVAGDLILIPPGMVASFTGHLEAMRLEAYPEILHEARLLRTSEQKGGDWSPESFPKPV